MESLCGECLHPVSGPDGRARRHHRCAVSGVQPLYAAVNPAVIWNESGVTGYNLGLSNQNAMTVYYELQYLLKHHTPQVVCIDANSIVSDRTPENEE